MHSKYQGIFNNLEKELNYNYRFQCDKINNNIFNQLNLKNNFVNERTLAYFSTSVFEQLLNNSSLSYGVINEACFKLNRSITSSARKRYKRQVGNLSTKKYEGNLEPDTVINFEYKRIKYNYFVEYKVHKKVFKYIELANDYLKYKIYTTHAKVDTKFVYIIFNVVNDRPTILNKTDNFPKIQYLNKTISKSNIDKEANVFIYDPIESDNLEMVDESINLEDYIGIKEIKILDKVVKDAEKIYLKKDIDFDKIIDYSENDFIKNLSCLGNKVSTAKVLLRQNKGIAELMNYLNIEKEELIITANNFSKKELNDLSGLFRWMSDYISNLSKDIFQEGENSVNSVLLNTNRRKSMFVLILLEKYCNDNKLKFINIVPKNARESKDLNVIRDMPLFKNLYKQGEYKYRYEILIKTIVYFLSNLYSIVYEQDGEEVVFDELDEPTYNERYSSYLLKKSIVEKLREVKSSFNKAKNFRVDWNVDLEDFGLSLLEILSKGDFSDC